MVHKYRDNQLCMYKYLGVAYGLTKCSLQSDQVQIGILKQINSLLIIKPDREENKPTTNNKIIQSTAVYEAIWTPALFFVIKH